VFAIVRDLFRNREFMSAPLVFIVQPYRRHVFLPWRPQIVPFACRRPGNIPSAQLRGQDVFGSSPSPSATVAVGITVALISRIIRWSSG
jgi:hypothetical protein